MAVFAHSTTIHWKFVTLQGLRHPLPVWHVQTGAGLLSPLAGMQRARVCCWLAQEAGMQAALGFLSLCRCWWMASSTSSPTIGKPTAARASEKPRVQLRNLAVQALAALAASAVLTGACGCFEGLPVSPMLPFSLCRLNFGNPWELERLNVAYPISFYGHVSGRLTNHKAWLPLHQMHAFPLPTRGLVRSESSLQNAVCWMRCGLLLPDASTGEPVLLCALQCTTRAAAKCSAGTLERR